MGAVLVRQEIHDAFMTGPEHLIEFFHGYTYSAHPLACAAGIGTLDTYAEEGLLTRAGEMEGYFAAAVHSLKGEPNVIDIRNIGLVGGIELAPLPGAPTRRIDLYLLMFFSLWLSRGKRLRADGRDARPARQARQPWHRLRAIRRVAPPDRQTAASRR
jgi:adenosylmethionine-8-amino-7-oxononanoate aminotransferase